jgi:hypothetical protein
MMDECVSMVSPNSLFTNELAVLLAFNSPITELFLSRVNARSSMDYILTSVCIFNKFRLLINCLTDLEPRSSQVLVTLD